MIILGIDIGGSGIKGAPVDVERGAAVRAFKEGVLDEVADAVPFGRLVARAAPDPDAHGAGAQRRHVFRQDGQPVGESRRLNLLDYLFDHAGSFTENLFGWDAPRVLNS